MTADNPDNAPEHQSSLETLEGRLYSRTPPPLRREEGFREERRVRIAPGWTEEAERQQSTLMGLFSALMPWLKRLFIASIVFFLFAAGLALYGFWRGGNTVSPQNIALTALGPASSAAGEELSFDVSVSNLNELDLDSADLLIEYPSGTRKASDLSTELLRYREALGTLPAGQNVARRFSIVPFGSQGEKKTIALTVEYRQKGSNAIFSRSAEYGFVVSAAPVSVVVTVPKEISSGQTFEVAFQAVSNSNSVIRNLLLKVEYPQGFEFSDATPAPAFSNDTWQLGDLKPQEKRTVRIRGVLSAPDEEERTFNFFVGTADQRNGKRIGTVFLSQVAAATVKKPPIGLDFLLNGEHGDAFVVGGGQSVRADILWQNNLASSLADLTITAKLDGIAYDAASVSASGALYDAVGGTLSWDSRSQSQLKAVEPGGNGTVSFNFTSLGTSDKPSAFRKPSLTIHVFATGRRLTEAGASEDVLSSLSKEIRIASAFNLLSRLTYSSGPFTNSGPIPPKVGQETTYTVTWSLSNSSNALSGGRVTAVLPAYVKWLNEVTPASENVTYNPVGGEVSWEVGDIASGVGFGTSPRQVSFKVSFTPGAGQVSTSPVLVGEAAARAQDTFTKTAVGSGSRGALSAASLSDAGAVPGNGVVGK